MAEAGAAVVWSELGTVNMGPRFSAADFAAQVYEAMRSLEPRTQAKSVLTLKLDTSDLERTLAKFQATVEEFKSAVEAATAEDDEISRG